MGIVALCVTIVIGDLLERRHIYRIPEAAVGLAVGALCAAIAALTDNPEMLHDQAFDDQFFMVWLLPLPLTLTLTLPLTLTLSLRLTLSLTRCGCCRRSSSQPAST